MQNRDHVIIEKIISETDFIDSAINGMSSEEFLSNELVKRAMSMSLINIGELVKNLSTEFRDDHQEVPWRLIAGFRDIAAHKYQTLDMKDVYLTITSDIPQLKEQLDSILTRF